MRTAEDHNAMMARLSSKVSKLTLTVTMRYSRSSPCDRSRKRPAPVTITFVEPRLNCDLYFVMKSSHKRLWPLLGLLNSTSPLFLSSRKPSSSIVLSGLNAVSDQLSSYRRPLEFPRWSLTRASTVYGWVFVTYIHCLVQVAFTTRERGSWGYPYCGGWRRCLNFAHEHTSQPIEGVAVYTK